MANNTYTKTDIEQLKELATKLSTNSNDISTSITNYIGNLSNIESSNFLQGIATESINRSCDKIRSTCEEFQNFADSLANKIKEIAQDVLDIDTTEAQNNQDIYESNPLDFNGGNSVPNSTPQPNGTPREVSVGGFYPEENMGENNYVAGLNYQIIDGDGNPTRDNIGKETITISGKDYQVYTYDDPATTEKEHYIIGALLEDGERSKPTGNVYTIDYGNGDVYEFVDLDTNYTSAKGSERTPDAAMDTYVDILSVKGHAYNNVGIESSEPVTITDTGKTVSKQ